jgi:hypothetical protein
MWEKQARKSGKAPLDSGENVGKFTEKQESELIAVLRVLAIALSGVFHSLVFN